MLPVWAHLVYLDVAYTAQVVGMDGMRLRCCQVGFNEYHPECFPIQIAANDPIYGKYRIDCQDYVRSCMGPRTGCTLGEFLRVLVLYRRCKSRASFSNVMSCSIGFYIR